MSKTRALYLISCIVLGLVSMAVPAQAGVPGTINIQGRLLDSLGQPVIDTVNLTFRILEQATGGTPVWEETQSVTTDAQGLWESYLGKTLSIDAEIFLYDQLWLETVVDDGVNPPEVMSRTKLHSTPFTNNSEHSDNADYAVFSYQIANDSVSSASILDGSILLEDIGPNGAAVGQVIKWDGSAWIVEDDFEDGAWQNNDSIVSLLNGSAAVGIGTATPAAKLDVDGDFMASGTAIIGPGHTSTRPYSFVAGANNTAAGDTATIAGGSQNLVSGDLGTVGGGHANSAQNDYDVVSGGIGNEASGGYSTVGGGWSNHATASRATVAGGYTNVAAGANSTIGGGVNNKTHGMYSVIAGGGGSASDSNHASGDWSVISGGGGNSASGPMTTVAGGRANTADDTAAVVSGGWNNHARGIFSVVAGGGGPTSADSNSALGAYSAIGGGQHNRAVGDFSTVGGGTVNVVNGDRSTVSGGHNNTAGGPFATASGGAWNNVNGRFASVAGGRSNVASDTATTVGGGWDNDASGAYGTVAGGRHNTASGRFAVVAGGGGGTQADSNSAAGDWSAIGGGTWNVATGRYSVIGGGSDNDATAHWSVIGGGGLNQAQADITCVLGGWQNKATAHASAVVGGAYNEAAGAYSFIGNGYSNQANSIYSSIAGGVHNNAGITGFDSAAVVSGGQQNEALARFSVVGGGRFNRARGMYSVVAGGGGWIADSNVASGDLSVIGGGRSNTASGFSSVIGGGYDNTSSGGYATVPGGIYCEASGFFSFAAGRRAKALHDGAFVWADPRNEDFSSTAANQFLIRSSGGVGIGTTSPQNTLHLDTGAVQIGDSSGAIYATLGTNNLTFHRDFKSYIGQAGNGYLVFSTNGLTNNHLVIDPSGDVGIGTDAPNFKLDVRGTIGNNATLYHSDIRWKKNIQTFGEALESIMRLRGVTFEWKRDEFLDMNFPEGIRVGLIAQEVEAVVPELVNTAADGYKSVEYANLVALLIEAVKELKTEKEDLSQRVSRLESLLEPDSELASSR